MATFESIELLQELTAKDRDWIFQSGSEIQVISGKQIIGQGVPLDRIYIVLQGLLTVHLDEFPEHPLSVIGPGEFIGELSFLEDRLPTATVKARENSLLLQIRFEQLTEKLKSDLPFSARFHMALARLLARRLRKNSNQLQPRIGQEIPQESKIVPLLEESLSQFKKLFLRAEEMERASESGLTEEFSQEFVDYVYQLEGLVNDLVGTASELDPVRCDHLGRRLMEELMPYLLLTKVGERAYSKPRGYAGDYLTIEWIYQNDPGGVGALGTLMDRAVLGLSCAQAVRNRRGLITDQIDRAKSLRPDQPIEITSLACGPARELFDHYQASSGESAVQSHLVDIDEQALEFVDQWRQELGLESKIDLHQLNLVYLCLGRGTLQLPPQDLVYSIGLIDYFGDEFVIRLLDYIHGLLRPGGRVILGNFHNSNRSRALMDHLFDWKLIHRDEDDMNRIFRASRFGRDCSEILYEDQRVNLFACCERDSG
ncbi:MAG: cyclic nucleotide-binding domain-containing protein [Planctomycetota bacterium]